MSIKPPPAGRAKAWTPFWQRFSDPRATDQADTIALYNDVHSAWKASIWGSAGALSGSTEYFVERLDLYRPIPHYMRDRIKTAIREVLALETHIFQCPEIDWRTTKLTLKDQVELRRFLREQRYFLSDDARLMHLVGEIILAAFAALIDGLPKFPEGGTSTLTVPLLEALQLPAGTIAERITAVVMSDDLEQAGIFQKLRETLYLNACRASGIWPFEKTNKQITPASKSDLPPAELLETYLGSTPFANLLDIQVPFALPKKALSEHGFIIAKPGHGKTQLLGNFVAQFLNDADQPGLFILDPAGDWFEIIRDRTPPERLVVLDPETDPPPLNFFDFSHSTDAEALQSFIYLMSSLSGGLTDKQGAIMPYLLRLLRAMPGASLETLRLLMDEKIKGASASQFWPAMQTLPDVDQGFFKNNFYNASMNATKESISWKIYGAMGSDTFRKMFSAPTNSFDARAAMRDGKVVLARGSENTLGEHGLPIFMQYVVSQCFLAALARFHIPKEERHQCYLLCDEASHIFNHQTARILTECRKLGLSFISATQLIEQIPREVKAAIYGATSFKFAGEVSHTDANVMANEMRCKGEFIQHMKTYPPKYAEWAAYVSGTTERAIKITAPMMVLEALPKLTHFEKVRKMAVQETEQTAGSKQESDELPVREINVPPHQPIKGSSILEPKPSISPSSSAPAPQPDGSPPQFEIKRGKDNWIPQPSAKDQSNTKEPKRTSDEIAAARAALAFQVVRIVEDGLTPFINGSLQKFHGIEDYVDLENNRRAELKAKGVPIRLLRPDALSTRWDYSMILNTIVGLWSYFKKIFEDRRVSHAQQVRADIYQLIALRDRGIGHASLGSFSDEDLQDLCKMAERVLRATGASRDAERVNSLRLRHPWCS